MKCRSFLLLQTLVAVALTTVLPASYVGLMIVGDTQTQPGVSPHVPAKPTWLDSFARAIPTPKIEAKKEETPAYAPVDEVKVKSVKMQLDRFLSGERETKETDVTDASKLSGLRSDILDPSAIMDKVREDESKATSEDRLSKLALPGEAPKTDAPSASKEALLPPKP